MPSTTKKQDQAQSVNAMDELRNNCRSQLESLRKELKELEMTINQSQVEVNKHAQRNASATAQLQQVQSQLESLPKQDIRSTYEAVLDAQQRLFVMRGQLDKFQSDKVQLIRYANNLEQILQKLDENAAQNAGRKGNGGMSETVVMLIQTQEAERQRLAKIMHDGPTQALSNFIIQTEIAMRLFDKDQAKAKEELSSLKNAASSTFQKVRSFIFDLRPMMLDDLGLVPTINRYLESIKQQVNFEIRFHSSGMDRRLENYLEVLIFRAVQELLANVINHGQATQVKLQIDATPDEVRVSVEDNGKGFDQDTAGKGNEMGLKIIRDRVDMLGGEMDIDSVVGQGTRVFFSVPAKYIES
jgi:two-component system sensor histidine kinase DegS